jgi:hypothetical protein
MRFSAAVALFLLLAACSAGSSEDEGPAPARGPATVEVDNRGFYDMTIYVIDGVQRQRLGVANGTRVTPFPIPDRLVRGGSAALRFYADPIGGRGLPVSEQIVVEPGDTVELVIPPN